MKCKTLINLLDDNNEQQNYISILNLNPEKAVFLFENTMEHEKEFNKIKEYLNKKISNIEVVDKRIDKINLDEIESAIMCFNEDDSFVNLSCGKRVLSLLTYKVTEKINMKSLYMDQKNESIFNLSNGKFEKLDIDIKDMEVQEFIESTGGEIISHSTEWFDGENIKKFIDYIIENYESWSKFKKVLGKATSLDEDYINQKSVIDIHDIDEHEMKQYVKHLDKLKEIGLLDYKYQGKNKIILTFMEFEIKTLLLKTGTWLEILVSNLVKEIKEVDDIKSGVLFLWDDEDRHVKNELDVVAAVNSNLICISCKDTSKYGLESLNELEVYGNKIGGEEIKKVLVATKEPCKRSTLLRAKEMEIDIIIFNGDVDKLRKDLENTILR